MGGGPEGEPWRWFWKFRAIDHVGETPLKAGRYTYIFRVFEGAPLSMGLDFEKGT